MNELILGEWNVSQGYKQITQYYAVIIIIFNRAEFIQLMAQSIDDMLDLMDSKFQEKFGNSTKKPQQVEKDNPETQESPIKLQQELPDISPQEPIASQTLNPDKKQPETLHEQDVSTFPIAYTEQTVQKDSQPAEQAQVEQPLCYTDLSSKLQQALHRISSEEDSSQKQDLLSRFQYYQKRKNEGLKTKKMEYEEQLKSKLRAKPTIDAKSGEMARTMHNKPIFLRADRIAQNKKKRLEEYQEELQTKKDQEEQELEAHLKNQSDKLKQKYPNRRTNEEYFDEMTRWTAKKEREVEERRQQQLKAQAEKVKAKPQINQKSEKIVRKDKQRVPVYEREPELRQLPQDANCTFKPKISKRQLKYMM